MTALILPGEPVAVSSPSDADLLATMASLLAAFPGPRVGPRLSRLFEFVCSVHLSKAEVAARAERLEWELAAYLHGWHVLRFGQVSPAGLDAWAAEAPIVFLRAALVGCANCQRANGGGA